MIFKVRKFFTILLSLTIGALMSAAVFLWMAAGEIYDYRDNFVIDRDGSKIDVVLCLAGGKGRIPAAVDLWQQLKTRFRENQPMVLFFSGVGPSANFDTLLEQGVSKEWLNQVNRDEVVFENVSTNTFENAQIFSSFVHQKKWKNVLLVTAGYHMKRSSDILRKSLDSDVGIFTYTVGSEHFERNEWHRSEYSIRVTVLEYIKWLFYQYSY